MQSHVSNKMSKFLALLSIALSALSVVDAAADLPPIPADKSTPIHQRLALKGPNCEFLPRT